MRTIDMIIDDFQDQGKNDFDHLDCDDKNDIVAALINKEKSYDLSWSLSDSYNLEEIMLKFSSVLSEDPRDKGDRIVDLINLMADGCANSYKNKINELLAIKIV